MDLARPPVYLAMYVCVLGVCFEKQPTSAQGGILNSARAQVDLSARPVRFFCALGNEIMRCLQSEIMCATKSNHLWRHRRLVGVALLLEPEALTDSLANGLVVRNVTFKRTAQQQQP